MVVVILWGELNVPLNRIYRCVSGVRATSLHKATGKNVFLSACAKWGAVGRLQATNLRMRHSFDTTRTLGTSRGGILKSGTKTLCKEPLQGTTMSALQEASTRCRDGSSRGGCILIYWYFCSDQHLWNNELSLYCYMVAALGSWGIKHACVYQSRTGTPLRIKTFLTKGIILLKFSRLSH